MCKKINIDLLSPAEAVVAEEKVEIFKNKLSKGEELEPVVVVNLEGRFLVTDGNNRARAVAEYYKEHGSESVCQILTNERNSQSASDILKKEWMMISKYYGEGLEAFLKIRVSPETGYYQAQAEVIWEMRMQTQNIK